MSDNKPKYKMVHDEFLYNIAMNLAGASDCGFMDRIYEQELTDDQEFSVVNTLCLLSEARYGDEVAHNAIGQMFNILPHIKNEDLQDMMLKKFDDIAKMNSSANPAPLAFMQSIHNYLMNNDTPRIDTELAATTSILMETVKGWKKEDNIGQKVQTKGTEILQCFTSKILTKNRIGHDFMPTQVKYLSKLKPIVK
jgi:hypothetical protein